MEILHSQDAEFKVLFLIRSSYYLSPSLTPTSTCPLLLSHTRSLLSFLWPLAKCPFWALLSLYSFLNSVLRYIRHYLIFRTINFTSLSFFSLQNTSITSGDFFFFHFASGERWLHFSNANLLLLLYIPCTPTSSMHRLIKFPYSILTTTNVYPLTHKHVLSFSCNLLPQVSPASHLANLP